MTRKKQASILLCVALSGGLAACGGKSSNNSTTSHSTQQQRLVAAMDAFASCARAHGVPVPDANPDGQIPGADALKQKYINTPQGHVVLRVCQRQLTAAQQLNNAPNAPHRQDLIRFARCMRRHGVPIPDPTPSGETAHVGFRINKSSPQFQTAARACQAPGLGR
jgi:hypothetical protein